MTGDKKTPAAPLVPQAKLSPTQRTSLELLGMIHRICVENNLPYTLVGLGLMGVTEFGGFVPYYPYLSVALLYPQYQQLVALLKKELEQSEEYYLFSREMNPHYTEYGVRLMKRSRVRLPEHRRVDEPYYDYFLAIYPAFYAGDTEQEWAETEKKFSEQNGYLTVRKKAHFPFSPASIPQWLQMRKQLKNRETVSYEVIFEELASRKEPTKYVFLPALDEMPEAAKLAEAYRHPQEVSMYGQPCCIVQNPKEFLANTGEDYAEMTEFNATKPVNKLLQAGPELLRSVQFIQLDLLAELDRLCRKHGLKYTLAFGTLLGAVRHKGFIPWDDDIDVLMPYDDYEKLEEVAATDMDLQKYFLRSQRTDKDCNITYKQLRRNNTYFAKEGRTEYNTHTGVFIDIFPLYNGSRFHIPHLVQYYRCRYFKTATWASIGARFERDERLKKKYERMAAKGKAKNFEIYEKTATWFGVTPYYAYLHQRVRPHFHKPFTLREEYENLIDLEFEGHQFMVTPSYIRILEYLYSTDYMIYPPMRSRFPKHMADKIDTGGLFPIE